MNTYKQAFQRIQTTANIPDVDRPFTDSTHDPIYGLWNPISRATCIVLLLYSMEPPIYFYLNEACRNKDQTKLQILGPFALALYIVLLRAEFNRKDKVERGDNVHGYGKVHELGCFARDFLVFRGGALAAKSIHKYITQIGKVNEYNRPHFIKL